MWAALCDSVFDTYRFLSLSVSTDLMHPIASKSLLVMTVIFALYSPNLICTISSALQSLSLLSLLIVSGSGGLHVSSLFHRILFGPSVWIGWSHFSWFSLWLDLTVLRSFLYWVWMVWHIRPSSSTHRCGDTFGGGWVLYCAVFDVQKVQENTRNSSVVP